MKRILRSGRFSEMEIADIELLSRELGMNCSDTLRHCVRVATDKHNHDETLLIAVGELITALSSFEQRIVTRTVEEIVRSLSTP